MMFEQPAASCSTHSSLSGPFKRSLDDVSVQPPSKRSCNLWHFKLQSSSSEETTDDTESVNSLQGHQTEFVEDTPDTDTKSENSEFEVEYEIASLSEEDGTNLKCSSSGSEDMIATAGAIAVIYNKVISEESRSVDWEDTDDSKSAHETEFRRTDFWTCVQCKSKNNNPMYRYCQKCFQARKSLFPPRPKRRRRRSISSRKKSNKQDLPHTITSSLESGIGSSQGFTSTYETEANQHSNTTSTSSGCSSIQVNEDRREDAASVSSLPEYKEPCIICNVESKNSIFLHGKVGHMCCCYKCAMRTWMTSKRCPVCNCPVKNVIKVFVM